MTSSEVAVRHDSMAAKVQYAKVMADSGLLPAAYRKNPANVLYAVEYGEMLGLAPMAAINGIHVIDGKPTASASLISALVRRAGHRLRVSSDGTKAVAEIVRSDDPEYTFRCEWTLDRAKAAGLTGKDVWKKYPAAMLKARAITEVARDACEEALSGVHYTPEELGAAVDEDGVPVQVDSERVSIAVEDTHDWASEIAAAGTDVEALKELYKQARDIYGSSNPALAKTLTEAGKAARDAAAAAAAASEVIDGEIVEDTEPVPAPEAAAVTTLTDTPAAAKLRTQLANRSKAAHIDEALTEARFKGAYGHGVDAGTEAELMEFIAKMQKTEKVAA